MPRKAANPTEPGETANPRRSSRIRGQPKAEAPPKKIVKPRAKKASDVPRGMKRKAEEDEVNGAEDDGRAPVGKRPKPASKTTVSPVAAKPASEASAKPTSMTSVKPTSKATAKPASRAPSARPVSRAGSKKPASKAGGQPTASASANINTIAEEPEAAVEVEVTAEEVTAEET